MTNTILNKAYRCRLAINTVTILMGIIVFINKGAYCQDVHFSQFAASPLNLNPAMTGNFDGDYRFIGNHRKQWKSVTTPYVNFSGSFDASVPIPSMAKTRVSAGLIFNNDRAGDSKMGMNAVAASFSLLKPISKDSAHYISCGINTGITYRSIRYESLTFDEQYDGDVFNPNIGNTEDFTNNSHSYFDLGLGLQYIFRSNQGFKMSIGSGISHVNKPDDGFFNEQVKIFPRLQHSLLMEIPIATKLKGLPSISISKQGGNSEFIAGSSVQYTLSELPGRSYSLSTGLWYRAGDALIPFIGIQYNMARLGISYDVNNSSLERASNGRGGYELSFSYIIKKVKSSGIKPPCPLY
ncbi:MAG: PorP/SprF family type IX secretion system membrane protein [Bacteroidota bacterium]|jgi:type IX secretion system PorP/SprF family membrane protein